MLRTFAPWPHQYRPTGYAPEPIDSEIAERVLALATTYPAWTCNYSGEEGDRVGAMASELSKADKAKGITGTWERNLATATAVVGLRNRHSGDEYRQAWERVAEESRFMARHANDWANLCDAE